MMLIINVIYAIKNLLATPLFISIKNCVDNKTLNQPMHNIINNNSNITIKNTNINNINNINNTNINNTNIDQLMFRFYF